MRRRVIVLAAALAVLMVGGAARYGLAAGTAAPKAAQPAKAPACGTVKVHAPNSIQGLQVRVESVCSTLLQARGDRAVDRLTLLSVRQADNLLVATLEVAHFSAQAPLGDPSFRTGVFDNIGDTLPQGLTVGRETVYTSTSPGLDLASWIRGSYLYVLAVRDSYAYPKALLRVALQVSA